MRNRLRRIARCVTVLFLAYLTFVVGLSTFYVYAEAAAFLFKPKQTTPETTQSLTPQAATLPTFQFSYVPAYPTPQPQQQQSDDSSTEFSCENCIKDEDFGLCVPLEGEYINNNYSYMLTIPEELRAMQAPPPAPDHGFVARIKTDPAATLEVSAEWNDDDTFTEPKAVKRELAYLKSRATNLEILKRTTTRLDKRTATRYVAQYRDTATGQLMIEDKVVSVRKDCAGENVQSIVYVISLQTPAASYDLNSSVLEKILKRWKELEYDCC